VTSRVHGLGDDALSNTSYLVEVGDGSAVTIDPPRDVDALLALADRLGVDVVATLDTHVHADYVSGATELAARGVEAIVPRGSTPAWAHRTIDEDERIEFADVAFRALATPGHTPEHLAFLLEIDGQPHGVFSGGSLILGGAARTDLLGEARTDELARAQFRSVRRLAELPDATALYPTHGAGSFCLAAATTATDPTIGSERAANPLLAITDEDEFVAALVRGFGSFPTYYFHLQALNEAGPTPLCTLRAPPLVEPEDVAKQLTNGTWLIDARPIAEWATAHPAGAISNELRPAFVSWLGWVVPFGAPVVLIVDDAHRDEATRLARRIGYDDLAFLDGGVDAWRDAGLPTQSVEAVGAQEARDRQALGALLLDVRQDAELATLRIPGAVHLELGDIIAGAAPDAPEVITFCGHGERSATAASLLERRGRHVTNLVGGTSAWVEAGLLVER
jgi:glyoxylase-like metal-dependent hydrolase (beta-lactamase superfamily II)/rhodanese-related sulfurtransferase